MSKENAKTHNINLINLDLVKNEILDKEYCKIEELTNEKYIQYIMSTNNNYKKQELIYDNLDDVSLYFYYYSNREIVSSLTKFSMDFVEDNQKIILDKGLVQSSIFFLVI